uniref:Uncharacterized protein n=1 Tax=Panagrolaimus superbus TaxID=310955 RepID=A0A914YVA9_9BILA
MLPGNTPVDFRQIWGPMIVNLGGELVDNYPSEHEKAIEFFKTKNTTDYFVADDGATPQDLINAVIEGGAIAVTSEWVIQTVITGLLATTSGDESYMLHSK